MTDDLLPLDESSSPAPDDADGPTPASLADLVPPPLQVDADPIATPRPPRGGGRGLATLLAVGLLSAALSSTGTAVVVTGLLSAAPTASPAASASASSVAARTVTTVTDGDITAIVAKVTPSVVTITATTNVRSFFGSGRGTSVGSGIVITADGYILTNRHVVEGASSLSVELSTGRQVTASVVKILDTTDLALIKADATGLTPATIGDSSSLKVGQTAIAIGSPLGEYTETVTRGIVSGLDREITVADDYTRSQVTLSGLIQTDAAINPGNSGGPLLDALGDVIGIDTAVATSAEGLGFAIPVSAASSLIALARSGASA
jgi:S1-C subfamily serine protease